MKKIFIFTLALFFLIGCKTDKKQSASIEKKQIEKPTTSEPKLIKEVGGFIHPESVVFDAKRNVLYVSNIGEKENGDGYISTISLEGELLNEKLIVGLNDPKGQQVLGDKFYVSDNLELIEVDLNTAKITNKYTHPDVEFLNDVTADANGNVYVSDMFASAIYKLDASGDFTKWMDDKTLEYPNGLLVVGSQMYIGGWGLYSEEGAKGRFLKLDMESKEITTITTNILGSLDGIQEGGTGNGFFVSDWRGGFLYHISKSGEIDNILTPGESVGDIYYNTVKNIMVLPMNKQNKLLFYEVK